MRWLYTDTAIIAPPLRLEVLDIRLRFELALLELYVHFGKKSCRERCASLRREMHGYLCSDRMERPPPQFYLWLRNTYTGQAPFQEYQCPQKGSDYREGVSMEGESLHRTFSIDC